MLCLPPPPFVCEQDKEKVRAKGKSKGKAKGKAKRRRKTEHTDEVGRRCLAAAVWLSSPSPLYACFK